MLAGRHPDGTVLTAPVLRVDPRGRLPAGPLVAAITAAASVREMTPTALLTDAAPGDVGQVDPGLAEQFEAIAGPGRHTIPASLAGRLATAAGLDPAQVYPDEGRTVGYTRALSFEGLQVDVRRAGLDVTVSAPKSVSVLWAAAAVSDDPAADEVRRAHAAAVDAALEYLQDQAGHGLRGHQGNGRRAARIGTDGLLVAAFEHRTSRAGDPQLHTHLVIPNLVRGADGRWSSVDSRALFRHALTASHVYHAVLRAELTRRLGVRWGPVRRGIAELVSIPLSVRREFSVRRRLIEGELLLTGRTGAAAAQQACLLTRPVKTAASQDGPGLRERWERRLRALGHRPAVLVAQAVGQARRLPPAEPAGLVAALLAADGLTDKRSAFDRRAVVQALCQQLPAGTPITLAGLDQLAEQVLADPGVVRLLGGEDAAFSTAGMVSTEHAALILASSRAQAGVGLAPTDHLGRVISGVDPTLPALSWPQARAVLELTSSGRGVEVLIGAAGSGKTAALAVANSCWTEAGVPVIGAAMAASAARNLQTATGIPSSSLARLFGDLDRATARGEPALRAGTVVVIDEAGMVGTRELHRLLQITATADAKLVLIGDPRQLPEIHAGGLFAALADQLPAVAMTGNQRQREAWERDALAQLRAGLTEPALAAYNSENRIHVQIDTPMLTEQLATDYLRHRQSTASPFDVLIVTARNAADQANEAVREQLQRAGQLGAQSVIEDGELHRSVSVGELVMVTANDYSRDVLNGTRALVTAHYPGRGDDPGQLELRTSDERTVTIPAGWLLDGRLVPAYALTCYKAQGLTCEHALVYGTAALSQQSGYVAMSRGRTSNHLYTILDPSVSGDKPDSGLENREVLDDLCRALARDDRQQLASPRLAAPARELQPDPFQQWALQAAQNRSERDRADDHQWDFDHHQAHDIGRSR